MVRGRVGARVRGRVGARVRGRVGGVRVRAGVRGGGDGVGVEVAWRYIYIYRSRGRMEVAHLDRLVVRAREEEAPWGDMGRYGGDMGRYRGDIGEIWSPRRGGSLLRVSEGVGFGAGG